MTNWIVGLWVVMSLALAPVAGAFGICDEVGKASMSASSDMPPCDMPCKNCGSNSAKKSCVGDCMCVKTLFTASPEVIALEVSAARPELQEETPPFALARPPDTPPPRSFLV